MKFIKETADRIVELYQTGKHSVQDICDNVGISRPTFYAWQERYPKFKKRMQEAHVLRIQAIGDLAESALTMLLSKHEYEEVTTEYIESKDGKPKIKSQKKVKKFIMPNPAMVALALTNAKSDDYKNRHELNGKLDHDIIVNIE